MRIANKLMCMAATIAMLAFTGTTSAQVGLTGNCNGCVGGRAANCGPRPGIPCPQAAPSNDCIGSVGLPGQRYLGARGLALAAQDNYSPDPLYTYSATGLDATRMNYWNRNTAAPQHAWHGNYKYWRYGQPTALIVPPTAAFQTEYNWGVGQTRSIPIYHQYQSGGVVAGANGGNGAAYQGRPYWTSSTSQFGIYPVRSPW